MQTNVWFVFIFFVYKKPGEQDDFEVKIVRNKVSVQLRCVSVCESDKSGKYLKYKYHIRVCVRIKKKIVCLFCCCAKSAAKGCRGNFYLRFFWASVWRFSNVQWFWICFKNLWSSRSFIHFLRRRKYKKKILKLKPKFVKIYGKNKIRNIYIN